MNEVTKGLISVIMPCYNQAQYLPDALQSVLSQTYEHWECMIVDDGSTDETEQVAREWLLRDPRFRYHKLTNSGVSAARNFGISKAKGEFILPLDGDDKIHSEYLERAVAVFNADPQVRLVYCKLEYFGLKSDWVLPPYNYKDLLIENMIFCTALMRKDDIVAMGGYDEEMTHGFEDWEFYINFLNSDAKVHCIDKVLFYYRLKEHSRDADLSRSKEKMKLTLEYISLKHYKTYTKYYGSMIEVLRQNKELTLKNILKNTLKEKIRFLKK